MKFAEGVQGNIFVNGEILNDTQMRALSGFVPQFDLVYESLTVFQHMKLMVRLILHYFLFITYCNLFKAQAGASSKKWCLCVHICILFIV